MATPNSDLQPQQSVYLTNMSPSYLNGRVGTLVKKNEDNTWTVVLDGEFPWYKHPSTDEMVQTPLYLPTWNLKLSLSALDCRACLFRFDQGHLQKCSRCRFVRYCSEACQADDWQDLKQYCNSMRQLRRKGKKAGREPLSIDRATRIQQLDARAKRAHNEGDYAAAERDLRRLISEEGVKSYSTFYVLGDVLLRQARPNEAAVALELSAALAGSKAPDLASIYGRLATCYYQTERIEKYLNALRWGVARVPGDSFLRQLLVDSEKAMIA